MNKKNLTENILPPKGFYWFDESSKDWQLFGLFTLVQCDNPNSAEGVQYHVEWLDRHYDSVKEMLLGHLTDGRPRSSPEYRAAWETYESRHQNWSLEEIKVAVNILFNEALYKFQPPKEEANAA